ncbi:MAG TPA: Ig domain-containing protein, partial [Terracidiphilus sp.]|nr:Ig domain-containing protein [Terracidiphilus sp.]
MRNLNLHLASLGIALLMGTAIADAQTSLTIQTVSLPVARVGDNYHATILVAGGVKPYTFTATNVPSGLTLSASTGVISGIPKASAIGNRQVAVTVKDASKPTSLAAQKTLTLGVNDAETVEACGQLALGSRASLNGFVPFEPGDVWVADISAAPLDPDNAAITSASGFAGLHLHHDWSSVNGGNYGIPYVVVDSSTTPLVNIHVIDYADESDVARAPYPLTAPIEGGPKDCSGWPDKYIGDAHVLVIDRRTCMLYETFNTHRCNGAWNASSETIWDLKKYENRPWGWTSADAAGLPIMPGLVRYDEIVAGEIKHAIRFTMQVTKNDANDGYFVEPATHAAGVYWGVSNVMGMRIRLKASFDISKYSKTNQIILMAMKKYGMILADNGGYFFFQGVADPRWNDDDLGKLDAIQSSNFEVVRMTPKWPGWDSATAPTGGMPVIHSFTASAATVTKGSAVTLQWNTSGDSYLFMDKFGGMRGTSITVH